jgi:NAD(P)-dependent dehydrogenase (short-subunit alcohol dehydrogenase family)
MDLTALKKMYDFTGQTLVMTGGTGVLGSEMTRALLACGANLALLVRDEAKAGRLLAGVEGAERAFVVKGDVLAQAELKAAAEAILARFGRIDGLINGAGGNNPKATTGAELSFFDLPEEALRFVFDLNILGAILPSQVFGRIMANQGQGVILNISSMSATRPMTRVLGYSAAKAGVDNFTRWLAVHMAREYSPQIRVNAIAPGFFLGEQNRFLLLDRESGDLTPRGRAIIEHTPMARFGDPKDLLGPTLWLLSPASAFVTGIIVPIDGGFSAFAGV